MFWVWRANLASSALLAASVPYVLGVPAGFLVCCRVYSALLLCWLPLFGAYSRRCGSCRPPEFRFGLRSLWCCCFFLDLGCLLHFWPGCLLGSCWFSHHGLEVLTLFWVWRANLASSALLAASVPYVLGVPAGFLVCCRHTLLCSFAGCRCSAPAPGAAALAGLLSFAPVYGRFGVFASSWIWGALSVHFWPRLFACFLLFFCHGLGVLTSSWRCANWAWSVLLAASVPHALGVLEYFLRVFWACFRSLVALSRTWVPAGVSVSCGIYSKNPSHRKRMQPVAKHQQEPGKQMGPKVHKAGRRKHTNVTEDQGETQQAGKSRSAGSRRQAAAASKGAAVYIPQESERPTGTQTGQSHQRTKARPKSRMKETPRTPST